MFRRERGRIGTETKLGPMILAFIPVTILTEETVMKAYKRPLSLVGTILDTLKQTQTIQTIMIMTVTTGHTESSFTEYKEEGNDLDAEYICNCCYYYGDWHLKPEELSYWMVTTTAAAAAITILLPLLLPQQLLLLLLPDRSDMDLSLSVTML